MAFNVFNAMDTLIASTELQAQAWDRIITLSELHNQKIEMQQQELRQTLIAMKESADQRDERIRGALEQIQRHLDSDQDAPDLILTGPDEEEALKIGAAHISTQCLLDSVKGFYLDVRGFNLAMSNKETVEISMTESTTVWRATFNIDEDRFDGESGDGDRPPPWPPPSVEVDLRYWATKEGEARGQEKVARTKGEAGVWGKAVRNKPEADVGVAADVEARLSDGPWEIRRQFGSTKLGLRFTLSTTVRAALRRRDREPVPGGDSLRVESESGVQRPRRGEGAVSGEERRSRRRRHGSFEKHGFVETEILGIAARGPRRRWWIGGYKSTKLLGWVVDVSWSSSIVEVRSCRSKSDVQRLKMGHGVCLKSLVICGLWYGDGDKQEDEVGVFAGSKQL